MQRTAVSSLIAFAAGVLLSGCAAMMIPPGEPVDYSTFRGSAGLTLLGDARVEEGVLRLTPAEDWKVGTVWHKGEQSLRDGFEANFTFRMADPGGITDLSGATGADGLAFVIQNAGPSVVGESGAGIGYPGIPFSLAIEFDTFHNDGEENGNHVSVQTRGAEPNHWSPEFSLGSRAVPFSLSDGEAHTARVVYTPGTMRIFLDGSPTPLLTVPVDLTNIQGSSVLDPNGRAWVGFTAATGSAHETHDILSWSVTPVQIGMQ